jgi:2,4-dienoyl-CoA reductase-like NADH-dependent reductase (Old Yellow Enzyme family)
MLWLLDIGIILGAKTRKGEYGGSYQNRTRFLKETIELIKQEVPKLIISTRLNISNVIFAGNSWGISKNNNTGEWEID